MAVPGQTGVDEGGAKLPEAAELVKRFSEAIMSYNAKLSGCKTGSLVQVGENVTLVIGVMVQLC